MSLNITNASTPLLVKERSYWIPKRVLMTLCAFFGFVNVYALRVCLSVAVQPMAIQYQWSQPDAGIVLSSFFWGYIATQVLGGYVATRIGGKHLLTVSVLATSIFTLLTPVVADYTGKYGVIVLRVLEGIGEGVSYPAMHFMFSMWSPALERSRLAAFGYSGAYVGTIVAFPISGVLSAGSFLGGWPATFYLFGTLGVLWCIWWHLTVYSFPEQHPGISDEELALIKTGRANVDDAADQASRRRVIPWRKLLTNEPFLALVVAQFAVNWSFYTCLTLGPTYLSRSLNFDLTQSGVINALPYIGIFAFFVGSGRGADFFIENGVPITFVRRAFQCASLLLSALAFVGITNVYSASDAVVLLTLSVTLLGLSAGGITSNQIDLGPELAGVLMGITNTTGTLGGIISPALSSAILGNNNASPLRWSYIFYMSAGINLVAAIAFGLAGSGKRQF